MKLFKNRLKEMRNKKGITQEELADLIVKADGKRIGTSTIGGYENGSREPNLFILNQLAEVLDTSADYLLGLTDNKRRINSSKDLAKIFEDAAEEYTYKGKPISQKDLLLLGEFFDRVLGSDSKKGSEASEEICEGFSDEQKIGKE